MRTLAEEKRGITVKIDADLHAEVKQYIEQHGITMAEFIILAVDNELHPKYQNKEEKNMGNMRTMAFQVPEELFQRIKGYLQRNNMSQKQFVIGLIESELEREQNECENLEQSRPNTDETEDKEQNDNISEENTEDHTAEESAEYDDFEEEPTEDEESEDEEETEGIAMTM